MTQKQYEDEAIALMDQMHLSRSDQMQVIRLTSKTNRLVEQTTEAMAKTGAIKRCPVCIGGAAVALSLMLYQNHHPQTAAASPDALSIQGHEQESGHVDGLI